MVGQCILEEKDSGWTRAIEVRSSSVLAAEQPADDASDETDSAECQEHQRQLERHAEEEPLEE